MGLEYPALGGLESARYRPAGEEDWTNEVDLGEIKNDSEHTPEMMGDEQNTRGEAMYAGELDRHVMNLFDVSKRDALLTLYKAGSRIDVELTYESSDVVLVENVKPQVGPTTTAPAFGSRSFFALTIRKNFA